jgi:hypothetical protein
MSRAVAKLGGDWMQGKRTRVAKVTAARGRAASAATEGAETVLGFGREGDERGVAGLAAA